MSLKYELDPANASGAESKTALQNSDCGPAVGKANIQHDPASGKRFHSSPIG
jgi:hypothetical protein